MTTIRDVVLSKLDQHLDRSGDGCWLWTGPIVSSTGYGANFHGSSPHRWAYIAEHGSIPAGMVIDHICHNEAAHKGLCEGGAECSHRRCCNTDHMRAVPHGENLAASPLTFNGRGRTPCAAEGCGRHVDRRSGYCSTHHRRWEKFGDPSVVSERMTRPTICVVDGCGKKHHAKGYCSVHAARVRAHGDPHVVKQLQTSGRPDVCVVEGCERRHCARGWCGSHWFRWRKHGDVFAHIPIGQSIAAAFRSEAEHSKYGPEVAA